MQSNTFDSSLEVISAEEQTTLSSKLASFVQKTAEDASFTASQISYVQETDVTQSDRYDVTKKILSRMIKNLRAKLLKKENSRIILMRRGETVSEVVAQLAGDALTDEKRYSPYDSSVPDTLGNHERREHVMVNPPLNKSTRFAIKFGSSEVQNSAIMLFCGPEKAVIQTAQQVINGSNTGIAWKIEPGLARYFEPNELKPTFDIRLGQETVYSIETINKIIGKETTDDFHKRIEEVVKQLKFSPKASTMIIAEHCVLDSIMQTFVRNGKKLTQKQARTCLRASLPKRIPPLSLMHFDIDPNGKWKPSCASLPSLLREKPEKLTAPDINYLTRPTYGF
ncbi:unnamed protein product [Thelazia callipaeda]|uniref:Peptidase_M24 domain-containing protein n=1 Tax=Thelazia callipaeda TaxID=103827 RepID=A0A0N5D4I2_THECL|nr:unnamed protein product [Thelazia callipaeda]